LKEDIQVRKYLKERLKHGAITGVEIQRAADKMRVVLRSARPGIVIGRRGSDIDRLREELQEMTNREISIDIEEVKRPELSAELVARNVAEQLARRISFRRAMKRAVSSSMVAGAKGIKVCCAGRLGGAEMSRTEWYREGRVPLHTIRADIDYACVEPRSQRTKVQKDRHKGMKERAQRHKVTKAQSPKQKVTEKKVTEVDKGMKEEAQGQKGTEKSAGTKEVPGDKEGHKATEKKTVKAEADKDVKKKAGTKKGSKGK
jgi:small subunit ribosomal protein S3